MIAWSTLKLGCITYDMRLFLKLSSPFSTWLHLLLSPHTVTWSLLHGVMHSCVCEAHTSYKDIMQSFTYSPYSKDSSLCEYVVYVSSANAGTLCVKERRQSGRLPAALAVFLSVSSTRFRKEKRKKKEQHKLVYASNVLLVLDAVRKTLTASTFLY